MMRACFPALCAFLSAFLLAGCGKEENPKTIRLSYSVFFPPGHTQTVLAQDWADAIEERSGGRVKITLFPGGVLTKASQCYAGVMDGISDLGMSCFAYTRGRFPLLEMLDLPVGYRDGLEATLIANELVSKYAPRELDGVHLLYLHAHGPAVLATKKKIENSRDLSKLKVRATGLSAKIVECLGAVPVGMSQAQTYEALQKGIVGATFCPAETLKGWNQAEVIGHVAKTAATGYTTAMFVVMNKDAWQSLPPDIKTVFSETSKEWIPKHGEGWNRSDEESYRLLQSLGKDVYELDGEETLLWQRKISPLLENQARALEEKGLPGRAFLEDLTSLAGGAKRNSARPDALNP